MGVFNLVSLALFAIGSLAAHMPENHNLKVEMKVDENWRFRLRSKKWAVLVAGSSGWENYRHQADVFHAYQILRENGIPKENIITMAADDIAFHSQNPMPGKIFNRYNGTNVYDGVVIDYKGNDVNSENFLNIITGNEEAMRSIGSGKVIKGGPLDKIFINYVDHGSRGLLSFPNDLLYADQLNDALNTMHSKKSYGKILLYIEACNSGSMFDGILRDNTNVLAVTASGPSESSWATYCFSNNDLYGICLGDLFSVVWMEEVEETVSDAVAKRRTVFNNFSRVRTNVTFSNVMIYGDFDIGHEKLSTFIGNRPREGTLSNKPKLPFIKRKNPVPYGNVHNVTKKHYSINKNSTQLQRQKLEEEISETDKMRNTIDTVFRNIYLEMFKLRPDVVDEAGTFDEPTNLDLSLDMFPCYRNIVTKITESCFSVPKNPYVLHRLTFFANLCVADKNVYETVKKIIDDTCSTIPKDIQNVH